MPSIAERLLKSLGLDVHRFPMNQMTRVRYGRPKERRQIALFQKNAQSVLVNNNVKLFNRPSVAQ